METGLGLADFGAGVLCAGFSPAEEVEPEGQTTGRQFLVREGARHPATSAKIPAKPRSPNRPSKAPALTARLKTASSASRRLSKRRKTTFRRRLAMLVEMAVAACAGVTFLPLRVIGSPKKAPPMSKIGRASFWKRTSCSGLLALQTLARSATCSRRNGCMFVFMRVGRMLCADLIGLDFAEH